MSSLEAKFEALMTRLNQQALKESTLREIAYIFFVRAPPSGPLRRGVVPLTGYRGMSHALFFRLRESSNPRPKGHIEMGSTLTTNWAQNALMENTPLQIEDANYVNNRSYTFLPHNNLLTHYHSGLRNHENVSYRNPAIVPHEPHQLSTTMAHPGFQNQGASSSNYQGNTRRTGVNELLFAMNETKMSNES